jgi:hypothetical protein
MTFNPHIPVTDGLVGLWAFYAGSLLDYSGLGHHGTPTAAMKWIKSGGVWHIVATGNGAGVDVADTAALQGVEGAALMCVDFDRQADANHRMLIKRDAGGTQYDFLLTSTVGQVTMYDGATTSVWSGVSYVGAKTMGFSWATGEKPLLYLDGVFHSEGSLALTITADDAPVRIGGYYGSGSQYLRSAIKSTVLYNEKKTADDFARLHAWERQQSSPSLPHNRAYFDMGSLVPNGPQTQYGPTGDDLVTDGDMEDGPGPEEITNGDMEAGSPPTGWNAASSAVLTSETGSPSGSGSKVLRIAYGGTNYPYAYQEPMVSGKTYRLQCWARGDGANGLPKVRDDAVGDLWVGTTSDTWVRVDVTFTAGSTRLRFYDNHTAASWAEFDDVSLKETAPAWPPANDAIVTKETADPHGGSRFVRVTYDGTLSPYTSQTILTVGKRYEYSVWARGDGTWPPKIRIGSHINTGSSSTSWQLLSAVVVADATLFRLYSEMSGAGHVDFDDVSVVETNNLLSDGDMEIVSANLLADSDMEAVDTSAYYATGDAILSKSADSPHGGSLALRVAYNGTASPAARQDLVGATAGKVYRVRGWIRGDGTNRAQVYMGGTLCVTSTASAAWQWFDATVSTGSTTLAMFVLDTPVGAWGEFDDITVTECEDDTAEWTALNSAVLSKQGDAYEGSQVLRVAWGATTYGSARQSILTIGKKYRITGRGRGASLRCCVHPDIGRHRLLRGHGFRLCRVRLHPGA